MAATGFLSFRSSRGHSRISDKSLNMFLIVSSVIHKDSPVSSWGDCRVSVFVLLRGAEPLIISLISSRPPTCLPSVPGAFIGRRATSYLVTLDLAHRVSPFPPARHRHRHRGPKDTVSVAFLPRHFACAPHNLSLLEERRQ